MNNPLNPVILLYSLTLFYYSCENNNRTIEQRITPNKLEQARAYTGQEEYDSAVTTYRFILDSLNRRAANTPDSMIRKARLETMIEFGRLLREMHRPESALDSLDVALEMARAESDSLDPLIGAIQYQRGLCLEVLQAYPLARKALKEAHTIFSHHYGETHPRVIDTRIARVSVSKWGKGVVDSVTTFEFGNETIELANRISGYPKYRLAKIHQTYALIYLFRPDFPNALLDLEKALQLQQAGLPEDHKDFVDTYHGFSIYHRFTGNIELSNEYLSQQLDLLLKQKIPDSIKIALVENSTGLWKMDLGLFEEAETHFRKAIELHRKKRWIKESKMISFYLGNVGICKVNNREYEAALKVLREAYRLRVSAWGKDHNNVKIVIRNIGLCLTHLDSLDKAKIYLEAVSEYFERPGGNRFLKVEMKKMWGEYFYRKGNFKKAAGFFSEALDSLGFIKEGKIYNATKAGRTFVGLELLNHKHLSEMKHYEETGQLNTLLTAQKTIGLNLQLIDSLRLFYGELINQLNLSKIARESYQNAIHVNLMLFEKTGNEHYFREAFHASEKSRSYILQVAFNKVKAEIIEGIPDEFIKKEKAFKRQVFKLDLSLAKLAKDEPEYIELKKQKFRAKQKLRFLVDTIETRYPGYFDLKYRLSTISLDGIRDRLLPEGKTLVEYFVGEDYAYAFVIDADTFSYASIKADSLQEKVRLMREAIIAYGNDRQLKYLGPYIFYAKALYKQLIEPLGALSKEIVVIPDGVLGYLPFDALLYKQPATTEPDKDFPFLVKKHCITHNYSATLWQELETNKAVNCRYLGFAPDFYKLFWENEQALSPLPRSKLEVVESSIYYDAPKTYLDDQATLANFKETAPDAGILHVASHSVIDQKKADLSYLAFYGAVNGSYENKLMTRELYSMKIPAQLVILSACNTGQGALLAGEGIISLAQGFLYAGSKNITAGLWDVNDASGEKIIINYNRALKSSPNPGKSLALRKAKLDYIEANKLVHPFYWSTFISIGDTSPLMSCTTL